MKFWAGLLLGNMVLAEARRVQATSLQGDDDGGVGKKPVKNAPARRSVAHGPNHHPTPINAGVGGGSENNDSRDYSSTHANVVTVLEEEYALTATSPSLAVVILNSSTPIATTSATASRGEKGNRTLSAEEILQPPEPGDVTVINGKEALDITDIVENMYNDTRLLHRLAATDVDAVDICKSYAFDPSQANWHIARTHEWLLEYALANRDRDYFRAHGLIATIAFDFLGRSQVKYAVGTSHLTAVDCPAVVRSVEDLEVARHVYYVLTSATHLLTISEIVHGAMEAAQSNLVSMVGKMALDGFYLTPTKGERERARAWQFFVQLSIWAVQSAIGSIVPMIPWAHIQDYMIYQASRFVQREFDSTGRLDRFPKSDFERWRLDTIENALGEMMSIERGDKGPGSWLVPPKYGDHYKHNPSGTTLGDWWNVNGGAARKWNHWAYGHSDLPMGPDEAAGHEAWQGTWHALLPDFRRRMQSRGIAHASGHAWADIRELCSGTAQQWKGKWWWVKNMASDVARNRGEPSADAPRSYLDQARRTAPESRLKPGDKLASWGPMESWAPNEQWRSEYGESTQELLLDVLSRGFASNGDFRKYPIAPFGFRNMTKKLDGARQACGMMLPVSVNLAMPMYIRDLFDSCVHHGSDQPHDRNVARISWMVQESGRYVRRLAKANINRIFSSAEVGADGSTQLSNALGMGSFLPADGGSLHQWTDASVEDALTKNMYFKTLNAVMRSQKHFISCTPHLLRKVNKHMIVDKQAVNVSTCLADNTGPQHLRACIPASGTVEKELVCYLYRWADRGMAIRHHVEEPWGCEKLASLDTTPEDIIKSSFLTQRHTPAEAAVDELPTVQSLAWGPGADFITDPTTPGLFSLPVCSTPYNWNGPTNGYTYSDDLNSWSARKSLPCYCGALGNETQRVWAAMRLGTAGKRREYLTMLCPRQIENKIKNPLERYLALCGLGVTRNALGVHLMEPDQLCAVLRDELESRGVAAIEQLTKEQTSVLLCKVHQKAGRKCSRFRKTPISEVWVEAEALVKDKARKAKSKADKARGKAEGKEGRKGKKGDDWEDAGSDTDANAADENANMAANAPGPAVAAEGGVQATTVPAKTAIDYRALVKPHPRGGTPPPRGLRRAPSVAGASAGTGVGGRAEKQKEGKRDAAATAAQLGVSSLFFWQAARQVEKSNE